MRQNRPAISGQNSLALTLCNLPQSTIKNTARRKGQLSVETLEQICRGLGISWSEFFAKEDEQRV